MRYLLTLVLTLLSQGLWANVVIDADTSAAQPLLTITIAEQILPGDYAALVAGLRAYPGRFERKVAVLNNIGGSTAEAMRIGRLLRASGFDTHVPDSGICQGSCVYLLAAGIKRTVHGAVAIHRPSHSLGDSHAAKRVAMSGSTQRYWSEMGIAFELVSVMAQASPQQPRLLNTAELKRFGLTNNRQPFESYR